MRARALKKASICQLVVVAHADLNLCYSDFFYQVKLCYSIKAYYKVNNYYSARRARVLVPATVPDRTARGPAVTGSQER